MDKTISIRAFGIMILKTTGICQTLKSYDKIILQPNKISKVWFQSFTKKMGSMPPSPAR